MGVLSRKDIEGRLADIFEDGTYVSDAIDRAAYNLRLDDQEIILNGELYSANYKYPYDKNHGKIILPARKVSIVTTIEKFHLSLGLAARGGICLSLANEGLIGFFGPQIDPGYCGPFIAVIWNSGPYDVELEKGDYILKVEFNTLETPSTDGFRPPKSITDMQRSITEKSLLEDIEFELREMKKKLDNASSKLEQQHVEFTEIKEGYRSTVLFGIFLIASAILGVVLTELMSEMNTLSATIGKTALTIIVLAYFISIPVLAAVIIYFIIQRMALTRKEKNS